MTYWQAVRVPVLSFLSIVAATMGCVGAFTLFGLGSDAAHTSLFYANPTGLAGSILLVLCGSLMLFTAALSLAFGVAVWSRSPGIATLGAMSQGFTVLLALGDLVNGGLTSAPLLSIFCASAILTILALPLFQKRLAQGTSEQSEQSPRLA